MTKNKGKKKKKTGLSVKKNTVKKKKVKLLKKKPSEKKKTKKSTRGAAQKKSKLKKISRIKKSVSPKKLKKKPKLQQKKPKSAKIKKTISISQKTKTNLKLKKESTNSIQKKTKKTSSSFLNQLEQELERILEKDRKVSIRNLEGYEYCLEENCDQPATTNGYCRLHYIVSWKLIKEKMQILDENKLKKWVDNIVQNHPFSVLNCMIRDFSNEKDFSIALSEMKIISKDSWHGSGDGLKED